jgi:hypothetical protein
MLAERRGQKFGVFEADAEGYVVLRVSDDARDCARADYENARAGE